MSEIEVNWHTHVPSVEELPSNASVMVTHRDGEVIRDLTADYVRDHMNRGTYIAWAFELDIKPYEPPPIECWVVVGDGRAKTASVCRSDLANWATGDSRIVRMVPAEVTQ